VAYHKFGETLKAEGKMIEADAIFWEVFVWHFIFLFINSSLRFHLSHHTQLQIVKINTELAVAHCHRGMTSLNQGDLTGAEAEFRQSILLDHDDAKVSQRAIV
jgi:hypothetical protein